MLPLFAGLSWAIWSLPTVPNGLTSNVAEQLPQSGVSNPVTAVLLNFRAYDTLLEIGVLLLALIGARFLRQLPKTITITTAPASDSNLVLRAFIAVVTPVAIVVAGYLLWVGAHAPGGAFQAGAVLAGAGVLLLLTDARNLSWLRGHVLRLTAVVGLAVFVTFAVILPFFGHAVLEYPVARAKWFILLIETAATISIAVVLIMLFEAIIGRTEIEHEAQGGRP
jgi:multisubunit Na+/H+ antiporter MnhB subunit